MCSWPAAQEVEVASVHQLRKLNFWVGGSKATSTHKAPHQYHGKAEASAETKGGGQCEFCEINVRLAESCLVMPPLLVVWTGAVLWSCSVAQASVQVAKECRTWSYTPPTFATSSMSLLQHSSSTKQTIHLAANRVSNKGWHCSSNHSQSQGEKERCLNSVELACLGMGEKKCKGMKMYSTMLSVLRSSGDRAISRCIRLKIYQG